MESVVIVAAKRTAVGKFSGAFSNVSAVDLGATVIRSLLESTGRAGVNCRCRAKPCASI